MTDRTCARSNNALLRPRKTNAKRQSVLKGLGQAAIFGIATRAIVENGCGLQAWQMFASHATERKMNASSIVNPH